MNTKQNKQGPLHFKETASANQGAIYGENGKTIAVIYDKNDGYGELFAAAPELLEVAKAMHRYLRAGAIKTRTDRAHCLDMLEPILSKAEGR